MRQESQQEPIKQATPVISTSLAETTTEENESAETDAMVRNIQTLGKVVRTRRQRLSWIGVPITGIFLTIALMMFFLRDLGHISVFGQVLMCSLLANYLGFLLILVSGLSGQKTALGALANTDDLRAVGVLAESLHCGELSNSIAGSALIRLLPKMRPEHAGLLTPSQRRDLRNGLKFARLSPALATAILNALAQIGDVEDLPAVERLVKRRARTRSGDQQRVRQAAEQCVAQLKAKIAGESPLEPALLEERGVTDPTATVVLQPETVEILAARLGRINRLRQRNLYLAGAGALSSIGLASISVANGIAGQSTSPLLTVGLLSSAGLIGFFAVRGLYAQRNLTQALLQTDDLRLVGPLLEAASSSEVNGAIAAMALTRLLPRLRASDAGLLDASGHANLNRALSTHHGNSEFVLAALKALEQVGDARALPVVKKLADRADGSAAGQSVREAALECLPFLQMRAEQEQASRTLLRASERSATPPNMLLRPVRDQKPIRADELLRPGTPRSESDAEEEQTEKRTDSSASSLDTFCALPA